MPSIYDYIGGKFLKARDLQGTQPIYQLAGFAVETIPAEDDDDEDQERVVVSFAEIEKAMVIGAKANSEPLVRHFGHDQFDQWDEAVKESPTYVRLSTAETNRGPGLRLTIVDPEQTHVAQLARQKNESEESDDSK